MGSFKGRVVLDQRPSLLTLQSTARLCSNDSPVAFLQCKSASVLIASFRSSIPSPPVPLFTLRRTPRDAHRKTRGRVVRYSFLVGLLHSLLHAGLARRTTLAIVLQPKLRFWLSLINAKWRIRLPGDLPFDTPPETALYSHLECLPRIKSASSFCREPWTC
jgi:hypothetical protein